MNAVYRIAWRVILIIFILVILLCGVSYYAYDASSYSRTSAKRRIIVDAYLKYHKEKGVFASSIEEMVLAGYLPKYGPFYVEPDQLWRMEKVHYSESTFKVFPMKEDFSNIYDIIGNKKPGTAGYEFNPPEHCQIRDSIPELRIEIQE